MLTIPGVASDVPNACSQSFSLPATAYLGALSQGWEGNMAVQCVGVSPSWITLPPIIIIISLPKKSSVQLPAKHSKWQEAAGRNGNSGSVVS